MFRLFCLLSCSLTLGASTVYTDYASWLAAAEAPPNTTVATETFANNQINTPGLSVASVISFHGFTDPSNARIVSDAWTDDTLKYEITTWTFDQPMTAFGGYFDMPVIVQGLSFFGQGSNTNNTFGFFMPNVTPLNQVPPGTIESFDGFWGFVTNFPFTSVSVAFGDDYPGCTCFSQGYTMTNLSIAYDPAPAPEPGTSTLVVLAGLIAAALFGPSRVLKFCRIKS